MFSSVIDSHDLHDNCSAFVVDLMHFVDISVDRNLAAGLRVLKVRPQKTHEMTNGEFIADSVII